MNYSDSERVASILEKNGYQKTDNPEDTDLYLFNTCSIRQKGEDRVYGQLKTLTQWKKQNPRLLVGITGCMVRQTSTKNSKHEEKDNLIKKIKNLDFVFKITDARELDKILQEAELNLELTKDHEEEDTIPINATPKNKPQTNRKEKIIRSPLTTEQHLEDRLEYLSISPKYSSNFQAFVPIQIGCDKFCTYCIVPYARGREQSRPMEDIFKECEQLVKNGCKEITLVGQTVNSYGKSAIDRADGRFAKYEDPFVELLARVDKLQKNGLNRLRFTSSHPRDLTNALIGAHANLQTLTTHLHLPVQAGDDCMLQKMNRKYTVKHYKKIIEKFRKTVPGASVTTDIIVGFCGETDEQFENTYNLYKELRFDMAYIARYSPRPGTVSVKAFKDDVPREVKAKRWHRLNDILEECSHEYLTAIIGKELEVLVESYNKDTQECEGRSRENKTVQFIGNPEMIGTIQKIKVTKALKWLVKGEIHISAPGRRSRKAGGALFM